MKLRIVALSHVLESETCELSAFFRDDPELFAPRVIFNGTFAYRSADALEHFVTFTPW